MCNQLVRPRSCNSNTVQLEVELIDKAGNTAVETRVVSADQVSQAQRIIAGAASAEEAEQNKAIDEE